MSDKPPVVVIVRPDEFRQGLSALDRTLREADRDYEKAHGRKREQDDPVVRALRDCQRISEHLFGMYGETEEQAVEREEEAEARAGEEMAAHRAFQRRRKEEIADERERNRVMAEWQREEDAAYRRRINAILGVGA